jgi:hypothetical protein
MGCSHVSVLPAILPSCLLPLGIVVCVLQFRIFAMERTILKRNEDSFAPRSIVDGRTTLDGKEEGFVSRRKGYLCLSRYDEITLAQTSNRTR